MKVLVVDDAEITLIHTTRMLGKLGHEAVTCRSGDEAIALLEKGDIPQVVLLDWMMPGTTGLDVSRKIRASAGRSRIFIIMLTARIEDEDRLEAIRAGADLHLPKPLRIDQLRAALAAAENPGERKTSSQKDRKLP